MTLDWHRSEDLKPKSSQSVLGYWRGSKAFLVVVHLQNSDRWWCTTGGFVPAPTCWTIPEAPEV